MAVFPSKSSLVATQEPDVCCPLLTGQPPFTELGLWLQEKLWNTKVGNSSAPSTFALGKGQGSHGVSQELCERESRGPKSKEGENGCP